MLDRMAGRARAQGLLGERVIKPSLLLRTAAALLVFSCVLLTVTGCNRAPASGNATQGAGQGAGQGANPGAKSGVTTPVSTQALLLAPEDLVVVRSSAFASGPPITGSIQPERQADLRAEVSAVVMAVLKENGDPVRRGDLLVRLDDTAIRDTLTAAEAALRAATLALDQAERQFERMSKLREGGMVSAPQLEEAETRRNSTQSEAEAARTRVVTARQQLQRTQVRAPFDGVVSDRKVSAGDTSQIGKELLKVIDPRSLRFEGFVSADHIGGVRPGQRVTFRVHGLSEKDFPGIIQRVNPTASATTRQVEVLVAFAEPAQQPHVSGLYAEGRIEAPQTAALTLPAASLVRDGDKAYAWRVRGGTLSKVAIQAGDRDARSGEVVVREGLTDGDRVLRYPAATLQDGQTVQITGEGQAPQPQIVSGPPAVAAAAASQP